MLPVQRVYHDLVAAQTDNPTVILQAPPGAGKSTWLPLQLILDNHFERIVMLEPRRLAARNIAHFLASQLNEEVGETIGLKIRGEAKVSDKTRLEIVTEGMLTRMLQSDPELTGVDLVIFDEFHERSLFAETALGLCLESQAGYRDDLKVLIMSATLDGERMANHFDAPIVQSEGRSFPIDETYQSLSDETKWLDAMAPLVIKAMNEQSGSGLVFLPGQKEIEFVCKALNQAKEQGHLAGNVDIYQLLGKQNKQTQQRALAPSPEGQRKIVLATNVAETSITIDGIRVVVDSMKEKRTQYNTKTGVTQLLTTNIAQSSAVQRAGRAGRLEPGMVYRLGSKAHFERRAAHPVPEILSSDISQLMLECAAWGTHIEDLLLLDQPTEKQKQAAKQLLMMLEALDEQGAITEFGSKMLNFGTELRFSHMLLKAEQIDKDYPGMYWLAVNLVALISSNVASQKDLDVALNQQFNQPSFAFKTERQYWLKRLNVKTAQSLALEYLPIVMALAYPDRIAQVRGQGLLLANGAGATLSPDFIVKGELVCVGDMGGKTGQHVFNACNSDVTLLQQALPYLFSEHQVAHFDEKLGRFISEQQVKLGELVISRKPSQEKVDSALKVSAWLNYIQKKGWQALNFDDDVTQLVVRMTLAHQLFPEQFPIISQSTLFDSMATWLAPFLSDVNTTATLKKLSLIEAISAIYSWQQQQSLNALLPERYKVKTGSNLRIQYQVDGPAKLAVRMQEMYGEAGSPVLAEGKLPVSIELLSPAMRPLQITQDLAYFWANSYREVQKEMKGRYPKHFWPDDPANAQATRKVKSRM